MPKDAVELLIDDHVEVKRLFREISEGDEEEREELFPQLKTALLVHAKLEIEIFYPAFREAMNDGRDVVRDAEEDHRKVEEMLTQIEAEGIDGERFEAMMRDLEQGVVDHTDNDEEQNMFPRIREKATKRDLEDLGRRMLDRKQQLLREMEAPAR